MLDRRSTAKAGRPRAGLAVSLMVAVLHVRISVDMHHPHVEMSQHRRRLQLRHGRSKAGLFAQGAARIAGAVYGCRKDRISAFLRLDNHVIGFRSSDTKLFNGYRLYVLAVRRDHCHF